MDAAPTEAMPRLQSIRRSPAQIRILSAALDLFADHGVSGTSMQMIADALGVTKAAIFHKFKTKNDIVLAVAETEFAKLEAVLEAAEAQESRELARQLLLSRVLDMAVERRRWVRALQNDPVMVRLLAEHKPLVDVTERIYRLLVDDTSAQSKVRLAMMAATI